MRLRVVTGHFGTDASPLLINPCGVVLRQQAQGVDVLKQMFEDEAAPTGFTEAFDPNAEPGTIRKELAESIEANTVHGSDSDENAAIEIAYFFKPEEIVG